MKLLDFNWTPTDRQLKQFGCICAAFLPLVAWIWSRSVQVMLGGVGIGMVIAIVGLVIPKFLKPLFVAFSMLTFPIGLALSELSLLFFYFAILVPIGIVFRIQKRDAMKLKVDRKSTSYWELKKQPKSPSSYYRQS